MAISIHERVGRALELLRDGLGPFVERELENAFRERALVDPAYSFVCLLLGDVASRRLWPVPIGV